jgi:hypothetical protein
MERAPTAVLAAAQSSVSHSDVSQAMSNAIEEQLKAKGVSTEEAIKAKEVVETTSPGGIMSGDVDVSDVGPTGERGYGLGLEVIDAGQAEATRIRNERMRQARMTFNAALALSVLGVLLIFGGVALLLFRDAISAAALTAGVGAVTEVFSAVLFKFNSDTNNRLDTIGRDLSYLNAAQVALDATSKIGDPATRDAAVGDVLRNLQRVGDPYPTGAGGT